MESKEDDLVYSSTGFIPCAQWLKPEEVVISGLYLFKHKKDLYGNSFLTYIDFVGDDLCMNADKNPFNLKQLLVCKGNEGCLVFGPIFPPNEE